MSRGVVRWYPVYGLFPIGDTVLRVEARYTVGSTVYRGKWWYHSDLDTNKNWYGELWGEPDTAADRRFFSETPEKRTAELTEVANDSNGRAL